MYHSISHHITSYHIISHHIISYHIISYRIISISYHIPVKFQKIPFSCCWNPAGFGKSSPRPLSPALNKNTHEAVVDSTALWKNRCIRLRSYQMSDLWWFIVVHTWFIVVHTWFIVIHTWFIVINTWFLVIYSDVYVQNLWLVVKGDYTTLHILGIVIIQQRDPYKSPWVSIIRDEMKKTWRCIQILSFERTSWK